MSSHSEAPTFQFSFLHPRYWHTWMGVGVMFLISWLPYRVQRFLGRKLGLLIMKLFKSRKKIAARNLELCFPEMTGGEREALLKENFEHMGLAFFETCMAWFWPAWRIRKHIKYEGFEQIADFKARKKGVLIVAVHSFNLELGARAFGLHTPGFGVYRPNTNPVYDWFQYRGRCRENKLIDRCDVKQMIRRLKQGELVWYAPDHDYGRHRYAWAPLFAVENACTTTGTHLLASASGCDLATFTITRDREGTSYTLTLDPPMDAFPYDDANASAAYTNMFIERSIMRAPEQYMWLHRRFKSRPDGEPSLYD
ncbi:lipid A biosynthesis lauroyl acyltransferase [Grimontia hollisae]|nr:LpxL/LpxP family Kdo(2)-lipid IV(A) lauroyl/palmitoleoyl acyltransferase [Grimontia hollisae]AMG31004.1 lipid A biosynthesis lauroyl acyltransferase [Grimontia hollisae]MDF2186612.1 LpxL/LpxP family Kdo(2)-lipid IV(A) lauroyl/palmitoleoyl acyltransferase [Grimontia hollisae]STO46914.1 Lipid A biosynthesis lauroyl acyltransferase [Grimontia hollisae]STO56199.1 Lipid A biosynthesis lauroyl acyltransferase [Grimontia hollisae]STQ76982.1 Lipid A biosynthesis lauroyl acyltransferase [Grimontia h